MDAVTVVGVPQIVPRVTSNVKPAGSAGEKANVMGLLIQPVVEKATGTPVETDKVLEE